MATKENGSFFKELSVSNWLQSEKSSFNFNLNHGHKCGDVVVVPVHSFSKSKNGKTFGDTVTDTYSSKGWNKLSKDFYFQTSKNYRLNDKSKNEGRKRWMNNKNECSNTKNNSTLSLHIAAYEDSFDASNEIEDLSKKSGAFKSVVSLSKHQAHQDTIEFPRQMDGNKPPTAPEVQQFIASQKLISPNQEIQSPAASDQNNTAKEDSSGALNSTGDEFCAYSIVVRTSSDQNSSTDGSVFIQLGDKDGNKTSKCRLNCSISHRRKFQRAHSDLFVLTEQNQLGQLKTVDVWLHPRHSDGTTWKLHSVNVIEHTNNLLYQFPCNKLLSDESEESSHVHIESVGEPFKVLREEFFDVTK